jgi:hypothetical protein
MYLFCAFYYCLFFLCRLKINLMMECNSWVDSILEPGAVTNASVQYICACSHSIFITKSHIGGPLHSGRAGDFALRRFFEHWGQLQVRGFIHGGLFSLKSTRYPIQMALKKCVAMRLGVICDSQTTNRKQGRLPVRAPPPLLHSYWKPGDSQLAEIHKEYHYKQVEALTFWLKNRLKNHFW